MGSSFTYNGQYVSTKMYRYEISNVYFGYVESHDLFAIANGSIPISTFFKYKQFNSIMTGFGSSYGKYTEVYASVRNHQLSHCSPSELTSYLSYAIFSTNKFLGNKGYGYLTD